jgi:hypothetical protein
MICACLWRMQRACLANYPAAERQGLLFVRANPLPRGIKQASMVASAHFAVDTKPLHVDMHQEHMHADSRHMGPGTRSWSVHVCTHLYLHACMEHPP